MSDVGNKLTVSPQGLFLTDSSYMDSSSQVDLQISSPHGPSNPDSVHTVSWSSHHLTVQLLCWRETDWGELSGDLHQPLTTHWAAIHNFQVIHKSRAIHNLHHHQDIEQFTYPYNVPLSLYNKSNILTSSPWYSVFSRSSDTWSHAVNSFWVWSISLSMIHFIFIFYWNKIAFQC